MLNISFVSVYDGIEFAVIRFCAVWSVYFSVVLASFVLSFATYQRLNWMLKIYQLSCSSYILLYSVFCVVSFSFPMASGLQFQILLYQFIDLLFQLYPS